MNAPANARASGGFARDLMASLVVFLIALPLCMGIAIASGVPPAAGLITGIIGGLVVGSIAGSPLQVSGPAAGLAVLVFELVREHGIAALGPVILVAGAVQLLAGLLRAGLWFRMVSPAVVNGMLAGIGALIVASQAHVLFDAKPLSKGLHNFAAIPERVYNAFVEGEGMTAGLLGLGTIVLMMLWDKLRPEKLKLLPGALIAIIAATVVAVVFQLPVKRVELPDSLWQSIQWTTPAGVFDVFMHPGTLLLSALAFALIASAETLLSAAAVDRMHDGPRTHYDRELGAQGLGNMLCGLLGALPMTGVIVRSAANVQAGARTRASAILHAVWLLAFVVVLPDVLRLTPVCGLAAILVYTGVKMIKPQQVRELAQYGRGTVGAFLVTAFTIVATDLLVGVATGIGFSLLLLALRAARLHLSVKPTPDEPQTVVLRLVGSATFLNVPSVARQLDAVKPGTSVRLDISRLRHIDHACLTLLQDWARTAPRQGSQLLADWDALEARSDAASPQRGLVQATA